jgi:hypothetical protein
MPSRLLTVRFDRERRDWRAFKQSALRPWRSRTNSDANCHWVGELALGRRCCSLGPVNLPGKRTQAQAHHRKTDQPAKIRDEPSDG